MRLKLFAAILTVVLLLIGVSALGAELCFLNVPSILYPGKAEPIHLSLPESGTITLEVLDSYGNVVNTIRNDFPAAAGELIVAFNGCTPQGTPLPIGSYTLRLTQNGHAVLSPFSAADPAPVIHAAALVQPQLTQGTIPALTCITSTSGTLHVLLHTPSGTAVPGGGLIVQEGSNELLLDPSLFTEAGDYLLSLTLQNAAGLSSNTTLLSLQRLPQATPKPVPIIRPAPESVTIPGDFWSMEVGLYDWEAIWEVMISPMTIIRGSGKEAQKQTYRLRLHPDKSLARENIVGEITCETQGVNVLETLDNGWTYIEAYNSSYGPRNTSRRGYGETDALIRGYVETALLDTFVPRSEYGLLIDKLTQRLYILTEKGLFSTLLISTGFPTKEQPWNETPAGEFYLCSKVGDFPSGNMTCGYGMRFNSGDILHEVPYLVNEKYNIRDYSYTEKYLGEKASHGCVRVQRKQNEDGVNMRWIWDNVPLKTKLLIWDDTGRPISYPVPDDTPIYFNPDGGRNYHADPNCSAIKTRYLPLKGHLTYGELDEEAYTHFTPCTHCDPPIRKREVDAINAENGF